MKLDKIHEWEVLCSKGTRSFVNIQPQIPKISKSCFFTEGSVDKYPGSFRNCKCPEERNGKVNFLELLAEH